MIDFLSIETLREYVISDNSVKFKENINDLPDDVIDFMELLNDEEKEHAIKWSRDVNVYLVHKMFETVMKIESIEFIKIKQDFYKDHHLCDEEGRTWLHTAVKNNRSNEILSFLIYDIKVDLTKVDEYEFTVLHFACQKQEYNKGELDILIQTSDQLIARSIDDVTPLELACSDKLKLKEIKKNQKVDLNMLIGQIDNINYGLLVTEDCYFRDNQPVDKVWLGLLQKDDKYRLINYIKKDLKFNENYYLDSQNIMHIFLNCHENGQGMKTYLKNKYFKNHSEVTTRKLFVELTGLVLNESSETKSERKFHNSVLFLALITGRFELVPIILECCQFDIISYGLLVCLICRKLSMVSEFPDQVLENIGKLKSFCEKYSMAVMNRAVIRDVTLNKSIVSEFLKKPNCVAGQQILDIAYLAKCSKFLSLPLCQKSLTNIWHKKSRKCPSIKFYLHSAIHCIFLGLFAYFLVHDFYSRISVMEIICYIYGLGYFIEESRQIYTYKKNGFVKSYIQDATNYIDISALACMLLGFILRLSLHSFPFPDQDDQRLFKESKDIHLFIIRLILCISFILFFMRIIYFGSIYKQLGPKLKMISTMIVRDLVPLIFIFVVFITSFGVTFQALLYPNSFYGLNHSESFERKPISSIVGDIFKRSTYTIFHTHYALEEMEHHETPYFVNKNGNIAVFFLLVIFMIVVNIMLINLLIALFSHTVTTIIQTSRVSWKANRYKDIKEYFNRSLLPPPLNIFEIIVELIYRRSQKTTVLQVEEEENNLIQNELTEKDTGLSMSFKILQAFALRHFRHKLVITSEDKEYERRTEIQKMKKAIEKMEKSINYYNSKK